MMHPPTLRRRNGAPAPPPLRGRQGPGATITTSVFERLRNDILNGAFAPGEKLRIEAIRTRYEAGNSPVREALNRLSAAGLVQQRDQRGFVVAPISLDDLEELTETRCWVEEIALRRSIARHRKPWEEGLVLAFHRLSRTRRSSSTEAYVANPEWDTLHHAFHMALLADCGSRWLLQFCAQLCDQAFRYRRIAAAEVFPKRQKADEHERILRAAIDGRADEAVKLLHEHYRLTGRIIRNALSRTLPRAAR
jgi:DNA-binding GntR family transcriptional regulator